MKVSLPLARLGGLWATGLTEVSHDPAVLDGTGRWAVVIPYAGQPTFLRFDSWAADGPETGDWVSPVGDWTSSMDQRAYMDAVSTTREAIADGDVYQANICRVLRAPVSTSSHISALHAQLSAGNPAPFGGFVSVPELDLEIATASPELFLSRDAQTIASGPIKGTARAEDELLEKDRAENVMIVDLVRNDLARVCRAGSVEVPELLEVEKHPGLVHLVSKVRGELNAAAGWPEILEATFPPGSVTGAPKSSALRLIADLEAASREIYCGAIGWVDADRQQAELAVAIRTFWIRDGWLYFGTGAGITWSSDPLAEWQETELKAARLIRLANGESL